MNTRSIEKHNKNDQGMVVVAILILGAAALLFFLCLFTIIIIKVKSGGSGYVQTGSGTNDSSAGATGNNGDGSPTGNNNSGGIIDNPIEGDLGLATLACVYLPGLKAGRTGALDRRVAILWLKVKQDLDAHGIKDIKVNWGFRTNCQQRNVDSGGNLKAKPGSSPHECGRSLDISQILKRPDSNLIIHIFQENGWTWIGPKDPPHFQVEPYTVGEPDKSAWIKKAQAYYQSGGPEGGCRGPECAP